jgi:hypothetical protein
VLAWLGLQDIFSVTEYNCPFDQPFTLKDLNAVKVWLFSKRLVEMKPIAWVFFY